MQLAKLEQWSEITLPATFVTALTALKLMLVDVRDTLQSLSSLEIAVEVDTFGSIPANLVTYESDGDVVVTVSVSDGNESVLHPSDLQKAFRSALLLRTKRETGIKAWGKKDQATLEMTLQPTTASGMTFVIDCHIRADTKPFWPISQANYLRHLGDRGETVLGVPWNRLVQAVIAYFKKHGICGSLLAPTGLFVLRRGLLDLHLSGDSRAVCRCPHIYIYKNICIYMCVARSHPSGGSRAVYMYVPRCIYIHMSILRTIHCMIYPLYDISIT